MSDQDILPPPLPPPLPIFSRSLSTTSSSSSSAAGSPTRDLSAFSASSTRPTPVETYSPPVPRPPSRSSVDSISPPLSRTSSFVTAPDQSSRRQSQTSEASLGSPDAQPDPRGASSILARVSPSLSASRYASPSPGSVGLGSRSPFASRLSPGLSNRFVDFGLGIEETFRPDKLSDARGEPQQLPSPPPTVSGSDGASSAGGTLRGLNANGLPALVPFMPSSQPMRESKSSNGAGERPERPPKNEARLVTPTKRMSTSALTSTGTLGESAGTGFVASPAYEELKRILDREDAEDVGYAKDDRRLVNGGSSDRSPTKHAFTPSWTESSQISPSRQQYQSPSSLRNHLSQYETRSPSRQSVQSTETDVLERVRRRRASELTSLPERSVTSLDSYSPNGSAALSGRRSTLDGPSSDRIRAASAFGDNDARDGDLANSMRRLGLSRRGLDRLDANLSTSSPRVRRKPDALGLPDSPSLRSSTDLASSSLRSRSSLTPDSTEQTSRRLDNVRADRGTPSRRLQSRSEGVAVSESMLEGRRRFEMHSGASTGGSSIGDSHFAVESSRPSLERDRTLRALSSIHAGTTAADPSIKSPARASSRASEAPSMRSPHARTSHAESSPEVWSSGMTRSDSTATSRSTVGSRFGSHASMRRRSGQEDHHALLHAAFEQFEQCFSSLDGSDRPTPESHDIVKRMSAMVISTTKINDGLKTLSAATTDAQVAAEIDEDIRTSTAPAARFDSSVSTLLRSSNDQIRSLTEELIAFTRFERERERQRGQMDGGSRPVSRASTYRSGNGSIYSPPRRATTASPFEGPTSARSVRTSLPSSATRQSLRDPLVEGDQLLRRYTSLSTRSPFNGADSPTPASRRDVASSRSPLSNTDGGYTTPARSERRQSLSGVGDRMADTPSRMNRDVPAGSIGRTYGSRVAKTSSNSTATVRPSSPDSLRFPTSESPRGLVDSSSPMSQARNASALGRRSSDAPARDFDPPRASTSAAHHSPYSASLARHPSADSQDTSGSPEERRAERRREVEAILRRSSRVGK